MSATMEHQHMPNTSKYKYETKGWLWLRHIHIVCHVLIRTSAAIRFLSNHNDMWRAFRDTSRLQRLLTLVPLRLQWKKKIYIYIYIGVWSLDIDPQNPNLGSIEFLKFSSWATSGSNSILTISICLKTHGGLQCYNRRPVGSKWVGHHIQDTYLIL